MKRKSLTRAANQGKPLRVLKADVEGNLALGGGDHVRVGKAHLKLQVVLGVVAKTVPSCMFSYVFNQFALSIMHFYLGC